MALAIHTCPVLTGVSAEMFEKEIEKNKGVAKPLSETEKAILALVAKKTKEFKF